MNTYGKTSLNRATGKTLPDPWGITTRDAVDVVHGLRATDGHASSWPDLGRSGAWTP